MKTTDKITNGSGRIDSYDGEKLAGHTEYEVRNNAMIITHTIVEDEYKGKGLGRALVESAVESAKNNGLNVVAECSYANALLKKHPEIIQQS